MSTRQNKATLRKKLLEQRSSIDDDHYRQWSNDIIGRLKELAAFKKAETVHCYLSMNQRNEVNTLSLVKEMLHQNRTVVVPITSMDDLLLEHVELQSFEDLQYNEWGVPEPRGGKNVKLSDLDLVVVPMVGGDEQKNRMGYGKGFYDRFLKKVDCLKIGLCFERCMVESIPVDPHDVRLDNIITEKRIIN